MLTTVPHLDPRTLDGLALLHAITDGRLPEPPVFSLLAIAPVHAEPGRVRFSMPAREDALNGMGRIHGGLLVTLLDTAMGCAVQSLLAPGEGYTTLDLQTRFVRGVTLENGLLVAEGRVLHAGRTTMVAEARLVDEEDERVYAVATSTCLILRPTP